MFTYSHASIIGKSVAELGEVGGMIGVRVPSKIWNFIDLQGVASGQFFVSRWSY
jgi:hypothetical protein